MFPNGTGLYKSIYLQTSNVDMEWHFQISRCMYPRRKLQKLKNGKPFLYLDLTSKVNFTVFEFKYSIFRFENNLYIAKYLVHQRISKKFENYNLKETNLHHKLVFLTCVCGTHQLAHVQQTPHIDFTPYFIILS